MNFLEDGVRDFVAEQETHVMIGAAVVLLIGYLIYFVFAVSMDAERAADLIYVTVFGFFCFFYWLVKKFFGTQISECCCQPAENFFKAHKKVLKWWVLWVFLTNWCVFLRPLSLWLTLIVYFYVITPLGQNENVQIMSLSVIQSDSNPVGLNTTGIINNRTDKANIRRKKK